MKTIAVLFVLLLALFLLFGCTQEPSGEAGSNGGIPAVSQFVFGPTTKTFATSNFAEKESSNVIDGKATTVWASALRDSQPSGAEVRLFIDLGENNDIARIDLVVPPALSVNSSKQDITLFPYSFYIDVVREDFSSDGKLKYTYLMATKKSDSDNTDSNPYCAATNYRPTGKSVYSCVLPTGIKARYFRVIVTGMDQFPTTSPTSGKFQAQIAEAKVFVYGTPKTGKNFIKIYASSSDPNNATVTWTTSSSLSSTANYTDPWSALNQTAVVQGGTRIDHSVALKVNPEQPYYVTPSGCDSQGCYAASMFDKILVYPAQGWDASISIRTAKSAYLPGESIALTESTQTYAGAESNNKIELESTASNKTLSELWNSDQKFAENQVIVKIRQSALDPDSGKIDDISSVKAKADKYGLSKKEKLFKSDDKVKQKEEKSGLENIYIFTSSSSIDVQNAVRDLKNDPNVEWAEPNYVLGPMLSPNDPKYSNQFHLPQTKTDVAWDTTQGNPNLVLGIIDAGFDQDHEDLPVSRMWKNSGEIPGNGIDDDLDGYIDDVYGWNFAAENTQMDDALGHGTYMLGIAAANTNNSTGVAGECPNCSQVMNLKAGQDNGSMYTSDFAQAIYYGVQNGAKVISISYGGGDTSGDLSLERDAVNYAFAKNVLVVASAGNEAGEVKDYPAGLRNTLATTSVNSSDGMASSSFNYGGWVDLAALGDGVYATWPNHPNGECSSCTYGAAYGGTSLTTPQVAGAAMLALAQHPNLSVEQLYSLVQSSVNSELSPSEFGIGNSYYFVGNGRLDASKAVSSQISDNFPIADLKNSTSNSNNDIIDIFGKAKGNTFSSYTLEYGTGAYPTAWNAIGTYSTPVVNGKLESWNVSALADGLYTIRLTVTNSNGERATDRAPVVLKELRKSKIKNWVQQEKTAYLTIFVKNNSTGEITPIISNQTEQIPAATQWYYGTFSLGDAWNTATGGNFSLSKAGNYSINAELRDSTGQFMQNLYGQPLTALYNFTVLKTCTDSDAGSAKPEETKGSVTYVDETGTQTIPDECTGSGLAVNEQWCYESPAGSGNFVNGTQSINCANGCSDGACKTAPAPAPVFSGTVGLTMGTSGDRYIEPVDSSGNGVCHDIVVSWAGKYTKINNNCYPLVSTTIVGDLVQNNEPAPCPETCNGCEAIKISTQNETSGTLEIWNTSSCA
ncbi:MAG: S8 family serine peptidase [Candidatus Diapherotrites archaeon]